MSCIAPLGCEICPWSAVLVPAPAGCIKSQSLPICVRTCGIITQICNADDNYVALLILFYLIIHHLKFSKITFFFFLSKTFSIKVLGVIMKSIQMHRVQGSSQALWPPGPGRGFSSWKVSSNPTHSGVLGFYKEKYRLHSFTEHI